jgi:hypothetical protein
MREQVINFKGALPRIHPRLLPPGYGQIARNTRLENGALEPVNLPSIDHTLGAPALTIYRFGGTWLSWAGIVDVAPAPVAASRIYYTGDGAPKMRDGVTVYDLALPAPVAAPTLTALSAPSGMIEEVIYAYTWVTGFGEESPPSPLSALTAWSSGVIMRLSAFSAAPAGRNVTAKRIYRSQTSAAGVTQLFFVAEIAVATATYDHDLAATPMQEPIASSDYDPPPAGLTGLISMPNGMMAAFVGKDVYFSEPFQPHAWPEKYVLTTDFQIVGLATFGSVIAILTSGTPYIAQGTHPENFAMERMDKMLPCLSRRGIVDIGYACYFPSAEGLARIDASGSDIVSRSLFTHEQWESLGPSSVLAESYNGRYYFTFNYQTSDIYDGGNEAVVPTEELDGGGVTADPDMIIFDFGDALSTFGQRRLGSVDIVGDMPFFMDFDLVVPDAMWSDPTTGELFMLQGGVEIEKWDPADTAASTQMWRSKTYVMPYPTNFGAVLVQTLDDLALGDSLLLDVEADGAVIATISGSNAVERLPAGFLAKKWEFVVRGNVEVSSIAFAHTAEELESLA